MNTWIVRTPRGKKIIDIDRDKHRVIMGRLHDAKTYAVIGTILRQAPANAPARGTEGA
jgi:hypothetical protein